MNILQLLGFKGQKRTAAQVAKERLQIIVSHESHRKDNPDFIQKLQAEIIEVISKYIKVDQDKIRVQLERIGDQSVLELNVSLPESSSFEEQPGIEVTESATTTTAPDVTHDNKKAKKTPMQPQAAGVE
ncbi:MAG: cell division topological specificity factor MinE [Gammaproteobacteria bacterium]